MLISMIRAGSFYENEWFERGHAAACRRVRRDHQNAARHFAAVLPIRCCQHEDFFLRRRLGFCPFFID